MAENVLVFKCKSVPQLPKSSFTTKTQPLSRILEIAEFLDRDQMEHDPTYKQIIPYSIMRFGNRVLSYKRSGRTTESRLRQLYSIGVGGHINESDVLPLLEDIQSALDWARDREVYEEFHVETAEKPRLIGLLNDDSNAVGLVHFGVVYEYWLSNENVWPKEKGNFLQHALLPISEIVAKTEQFESWSQIVLENYLKSQIQNEELQQ